MFHQTLLQHTRTGAQMEGERRRWEGGGGEGREREGDGGGGKKCLVGKSIL